MTAAPPDDRAGLAWALLAYGSWGVLPLYFWLLRGIPAPDILGHRAAWSVLFLGAVLTVVRGWGEVRRARPWLGRLAVTAVLIGANWLTYIWCTTHGRVLDASLGYFLNPLVNVVLGRLVLGERLGGARAVAVGLAGVGVVTQVVLAGGLPWPAVVLPLCFGLYGLLRKGVPVPGVAALFLETAMLAPLAVAWLSWRGAWSVGDPRQTALLVGTGVVTALPLVWFGNAARRLSMSTLGLLQYLSPTGQFLLAVFAFGEPWSTGQAVGFAFIWAALGVYGWGLARGR